ncbi:hypothetical protein NW755_009949 [Fusarium falciforme]|uniref:Uncharacterized protein n=1 Tax=Fusarium falciforme TaxID=195108 RepID=A0A9W8R2I2_9HYPO|nr:hypothetical protein NW755_009949 [Fusarium falciforme]
MCQPTPITINTTFPAVSAPSTPENSAPSSPTSAPTTLAFPIREMANPRCQCACSCINIVRNRSCIFCDFCLEHHVA